MRPLVILLIATASAHAAEPTVTVPLLGMPTQYPSGVLAVAPDGSWAALYRSPYPATGKPPHTVQFWDLKTGTLRHSVDVDADRLYEFVRVSPDGRKLVVWAARGAGGAAVVIDTDTGRQHTVPNVTKFPLGFTADGTGLYAYERSQSGKEGSVAVWSVADGKKLREITLANLGRVTIGPDGRTAHHRTHSSVNEVWDFETGKLVSVLKPDGDEAEHRHDFVTFAGGGKKVVTQRFDSSLWVFDAATGRRERVVSVPKAADGNHPRGHAVADDLSCVLASSWTNEPVVFEPGKDGFRCVVPAVSREWRPHLTLTRDGAKFLRQHPAHGVEVFDAGTGRRLHTLRPDSQHVRSLAFAADGKTLVVGTANDPGPRGDPSDPTDPPAGHVLVWDARAGELRKALAGIDPGVCQVFPTADGTRAVVVAGKVRADYYGWGTQQAVLYDLSTGKELRAIAGPKDTFYGFVASADGRWLAAVVTETRKKEQFNAVFPVGTRVWDLPTGDKLRNLDAAPDTYVLSLTPDGERVLAYSRKAGVESWGVESNKSKLLWKGVPVKKEARSPFMPLALPRGDEFVALFGPATNLTGPVYWYAAGRQIRFGNVPVRPGPLAVSADGKWVAAGEQPYVGPARVFVWRLPEPPPFDEKVIKNGVIPPEEFPVEPVVLHGHTGPVNAPAFSPDGKTIATGGADCAVRLWEVSTGRLRATLWVPPAAKPGDAPTDWAAFTPEGFCAGTPRGLAFLRVRDTVAVLGFRVPTGPGRMLAPDDPLVNPMKVRAALGGK